MPKYDFSFKKQIISFFVRRVIRLGHYYYCHQNKIGFIDPIWI